MSRKYLCCVQREKGREPCASATTANRFTNVVTIGSFSLAGLSSRSSPLETRADLRIPLRIHPYFPDFPKRASTNLREIEKLRANVISFSLSLSLSLLLSVYFLEWSTKDVRFLSFEKLGKRTFTPSPIADRR